MVGLPWCSLFLQFKCSDGAHAKCLPHLNCILEYTDYRTVGVWPLTLGNANTPSLIFTKADSALPRAAQQPRSSHCPPDDLIQSNVMHFGSNRVLKSPDNPECKPKSTNHRKWPAWHGSMLSLPRITIRYHLLFKSSQRSDSPFRHSEGPSQLLRPSSASPQQ